MRLLSSYKQATMTNTTTSSTRDKETGRISGCKAFTAFAGFLFCSANLEYFRRSDFSHPNVVSKSHAHGMVMANDTMTDQTSQLSRSIRNGTHQTTTSQLSRFCQTIHEAHDLLQPDVKDAPSPKMVHAFVVNSGHLPLLQNALVSIQKLPTPWKSLVFALDSEVCRGLCHKKSPPKFNTVCIEYGPRMLKQMRNDEPRSYEEYLEASTKETSLNETARWATYMHKVLINSKLYALREILQCGLDVFLTDADTFFLQDPRPYFVAGENVIAQNDTNPGNYKLNMNSGFMYWRHTAVNVNLSRAVIKDMEWWQIDQKRVNDLLWHQGINVTILPTREFPNGHSLSKLKTLNDTVAVHANWNDHFDDKKQVLEKHGLWLME
jgi:hypothetical protein